MEKKIFKNLTVARWIARSTPHPRRQARIDLARTMRGVLLIVCVGLLSACSASSSTSNPTATSLPIQIVASNTPIPTQTSRPTQTSSSTDTPAVTSTPLDTAIPTALDPCQLIDSQEASTLAGASFGPGTESTIPGGVKICTYGSQTVNIFYVEVVQAADKATADAAEQQFLADLQAKLQQLTNEGFQVTQLPDFADGAVTAQLNISAGGETVNGAVFGFRKGTIFFGFSDVAVGSAAPTSEAMQSEATTVLGNLP